MTDRTWSLEVRQGEIEVASVELNFDAEDCKVFTVRPKEPMGFGVRWFFADGACYAVILGRYHSGKEKETQLSLRGAGGGWMSAVHVAGDGLLWTIFRHRAPAMVWQAKETP